MNILETEELLPQSATELDSSPKELPPVIAGLTPEETAELEYFQTKAKKFSLVWQKEELIRYHELSKKAGKLQAK